MNQAEFETELRRDGYNDIVSREMAANQLNPLHTHEFDARVMVLGGEMTITCHGRDQTYRAGDVCTIDAGTPHVEQCGSQGSRYIAGRRHKT